MSTIWCIIWRFQPFHNGHQLLVEQSLKDNDSTLVFIWSTNIINEKNPYSYEIRKNIISENFKHTKLKVLDLPDFKTDELWLTHIVSCLPKDITTLKLYCWDEQHDSAIMSIKKLQSKLSFHIQIIEIPRSIIPISATQIRNAIHNRDSIFLKKYLSNISIDVLKQQS